MVNLQFYGWFCQGVVSYGKEKKRYLTLKQKETKSKQNLAQTRNSPEARA